MRRPAYFSPSRRRPPASSQTRKPSATSASGGKRTHSAASDDRDRLGVDGQRGRAPRASSRARTRREEVADGGAGERRARAGRRSGPATSARGGRRACRRTAARRGRCASPASGRVGPAGDVEAARAATKRQRPARPPRRAGTPALRNAKSVPSKSTPTSAVAKRAGDERGQERAHAGGGGEAEALEDVEEELHRMRCR